MSDTTLLAAKNTPTDLANSRRTDLYAERTAHMGVCAKEKGNPVKQAEARPLMIT